MVQARAFTLTSLVVVVGLFVAVGVVSGNDIIVGHISSAVARILTPLSERTGTLRGLVSLLVSGTDIVEENRRLRGFEAEVAGLRSGIEALQRENEFLRSAAAIPQRPEAEPIMGGIFVYQRSGGVRDVIIDRGSRDWVSRGDLVLDGGNGLVGIVTDVGHGTSRVRQVTDAAFEVAALIEGTDIAGLAHAHTTEGMVLDLVQKDEQVSEGQLIVTSGADGLPAGIRIGVIRSVQDDASTLFRIVRVTPVVPDDYTGQILIVRP